MRNLKKAYRMIEIGSFGSRIEGFETLDIRWRPNVDYVIDASSNLPFKDNTFDLMYASHILEHVPWFKTKEILTEWVRVLKVGGILELWVPDGIKICKAWIDAELYNNNYIDKDGWYKFNEEKDPCLWASGRIFTYGDGTLDKNSQNWHYAIFSLRYLKNILEEIGMTNIQQMDRAEVRAYDHGWINLGVKSIKNEL